jgi:hypothetical protein
MSFAIAPHDYDCVCPRCASRRQMRCKFCGCSEDKPCAIHMAIRSEFGFDETTLADLPCGWLIPNVCTNPACVDKAYEEAKRDLVAICGVRA